MQVMVDLGQYQEQVQIEIRLDALRVESMITLARECPTRQENREIEQIQQMFNLDDEQTTIQTSMMDINDDDEVAITLTENRDCLNL